MPPAEESSENNSKNKSKRNKRKKIQTSICTNSSNNDDTKESVSDAIIELITTISVRQKSQQPKQQQQHQLEGEQAIQKQQQDGLKDEDENIAVDLEHQSVLFQVEKILSSTSGRSDLVFFVVRLRPTEPNSPVSCIYLGEAQRSSSSLSDVTLRLNDKTVAHVPAERSTSNSHLRTFGALATLQTTILYLRHREQIYIKLIEFYKRLLLLSRDAFEELRGSHAFWRQLYLLERYIANTSRFSFLTSNPATFAKRKIRSDKLKMVHEIGAHTAAMGQTGVVNSASLEDVPLSDASDRAQSIQSLHSAPDTPTPDGTPSYEELQQRLDEYNRHIEQMNEQKNQLMRMHNDAKQHLILLEQYQQECNQRNLSFGEKDQGNGNDDQPPDYNSVNDVQNDMNILSQRVKNITRIVNSQNQLVNQLPGESNEEMRADQENLEQKLRDLRKNGDDLLVMASELDALNTNASRTALTSEGDIIAPIQRKRSQTPKESAARLVPIRITSNELGSLKTIEQKESEIEAMKTQLRRLKDMMGTIESIENKANSAHGVPKQSNQPATSAARNVPIRTVVEDGMSFMAHDDNDHERTPTPRNMGNSNLERNLRILQGVSSDVRAQSERMVVEKERIMALQDEISRCSQQAAAAAQLGEDALKRHSVTPTPTPSSYSQQRKESEQSEPEAYEKSNNELENMLLAKSQEYEEVCRRLQELHPTSCSQTAIETAQQQNASQETTRTSSERDSVPVSQITVNETERNLGNFEATSSTGAPTTSNITGSTLQDDVSADVSSMQSNGSNSHAFSIPPSMNAIGGGVSWAGGPHNWNYPNFRYTHPTTVISPTCAFPPPPPPFAVPPFMSAPLPPPPVSLSVLTGPTSTNGLFYNPSHATPPGTLPNLPPIIGPAIVDQTMLQHCINQQQMFGQALNQLSTMLWQQQREIEYLHKITQTLHERLIRMGGEPILYPLSDIGLGFRSESVPPSFTAAAMSSRPSVNMANNIFSNDLNRAQSEQPLVNSTDVNSTQQYQQEQHHYVQQQHHHQVHQQRQFSSNMGGSASTGTYSETQQHAATAATSGGTSSIYSTLNNANVTGCNAMRSQVQQTSGHETAGPAPIFMHHHNNAIHQNNANLRRANVHTHAHVNGAPSTNDSNNTLNNQVPPGNRANNYWDNFKSYSRQNLLGPQSSKSNEDNQQQQQYELDPNENGEYNPQNPGLYQSVRHHAQALHRKCLHQTTGHRLLNEPNIMDTTRYNKDLRFGNQPRIKNFQQRRQQQPNPLPLGTVITNPLHANIPINNASTYVESTEHMAIPSEIFDSQMQSFDYPVNELDDQITAEIYGCNYEHPSTSITHAINTNERNVNFGNSPSNRRQGNKVAPKFQYRMGLLTEQSMRMIESFLAHWDDADVEGNQHMVLNNRHNINRYLRQLHQLQSTLRFDPNYIGPTDTSDYIDRQMYMRNDYEESEEPLYEPSDDSRDFENVTKTDEDVNINRSTSARCSNISRSVFERNLLVNNRNARKPEKFIKKQTVSVASRRLPCNFDFDDENRATFSDSTDKRRGSKNRIAGYGRQSQFAKWNDRTEVKNIKRYKETSPIRHAVSDSNVTETHRDILDPRTSSSKTIQPKQHQQSMTKIFKNPTVKPETGNPLHHGDNVPMQKSSSKPIAGNIIDYEPESALDESSTCEDIDTLGAYSLAAQEHFQKKAMLKGKSKDKDRKTMDKPKKSQSILEQESKSTEPRNEEAPGESKMNNVQVINDETASSGILPVVEFTTRRRRSRRGRNGIRLDCDCRALIHIVMACLRTDLKRIVFVDSTLLSLISKITASISQSALLNKEFPHNDGSLVLLSAERLFAKMQSDFITMPTRFVQFIPWYENYLETLLLEATAEDIKRRQGDNNTQKKFHNFLYAVEFADHRMQRPSPVNNNPIGDEIDVCTKNKKLTTASGELRHSVSDDESGTNEDATESNDKFTTRKKLASQNKQKSRGGGDGGDGKRNPKNRGKR